MIRTVANMKYGQNVADFLSAHLPADYSFNADALNTEGCSGNDNNAQGAVGKVYTGGECKVARWQNLVPSFPWIAPGWRAWGRNPRKGRDQILQRSVAEP